MNSNRGKRHPGRVGQSALARLIALLALLASACTPGGAQVRLTPTAQSPTQPAAALSPSATSPGPVSTASPVSSPTVMASPTTMALATPLQPAAAPQANSSGELAFPIRAAFYYPWFPQAWIQSGMNPFTHYHPALGFYSEDAPGVIQKHIAAMQYGKIQLGIASWWGQTHYTNGRVPALLKAGEQAGFKWALYIESEGQGDPTPEAIRADLTYIRDTYTSSPAYLKVGGRFVVFVYADAKDACPMAERWKAANTVGAYVVLKVFSGYKSCDAQPDGWHQYAPANAKEDISPSSYTISPGFNKATEAAPRLERDLARWTAGIKAMEASKANFQLVTTFNEWGEGTAVEDATEWDSPSGYGSYLDALHHE